MKIFFTIIVILLAGQIYAQRCATTEYMAKHPQVSNFGAGSRGSSPATGRDTLPGEVITIPVVVHVLYNNQSENISDAQIISQLNALNEDFRRQNKDAVNTPSAFRDVAADTRITFCLAKVDPSGKPTTGIIRKFTREKAFLADDAMKFSVSGGDEAWDASRYLNIWVCNLLGRTLGYAVLPGSPAEKDGVVIKYDAFGTVGAARLPYNKGRTATHEIGHWLGLRHLWGDADCGDDGIADTPPQQTSNLYCTTFPHVSACSINQYGDMFMNFMDFSDDACMNLFTNDQGTAMRSIFAQGQPRNSFLKTMVCDSSNAVGGPLPPEVEPLQPEVRIYPNPFINEIQIRANTLAFAGKNVKVYDAMGKTYINQQITGQQTTLQVPQLPAGVYFVRIDGLTKPLVYKVIRQAKN